MEDENRSVKRLLQTLQGLNKVNLLINLKFGTVISCSGVRSKSGPITFSNDTVVSVAVVSGLVLKKVEP